MGLGGLSALLALLAVAAVTSAQAQTGTCFGQAPTIARTSETETLTGTPGRDVIVGLGGDDTIRGAGGDDLLCGGVGRDLVEGQEGNDEIDGADSIDAGAGEDYCSGGERTRGCNTGESGDELPPEPPPAPPTVVHGPGSASERPSAAGTLAISTDRLRVRRGRAAVPLRCTGPSECRVRLGLRGGRSIAVALEGRSDAVARPPVPSALQRRLRRRATVRTVLRVVAAGREPLELRVTLRRAKRR